MRANFVLSEVGIGLRRNLTMTVAVIISVAVSLGLFGFGLLIRQQVDAMKNFWYDKVEVSIFLCNKDDRTPSCNGAVTPAQKDQIRQDLERLKPTVKEIYFEDHAQAYQHFQEDLKDTALAQNITPDQLPESFRVKLSDPTKYGIVASAFAGRPGVYDVQDQRQVLDKFFKVLRGFEVLALFLAVTMLFVAVLLIMNTMRVAAFSRRRETSIMRLVGASNFYIQLPFITEAVVAGLIGGLVAAAAICLIYVFLIDNYLRPTFQFTSFIGWDAVLATIPVLIGTGVVLAALASFISLRKYLKV